MWLTEFRVSPSREDYCRRVDPATTYCTSCCLKKMAMLHSKQLSLLQPKDGEQNRRRGPHMRANRCTR
jgi:hypothetical protein